MSAGWYVYAIIRHDGVLPSGLTGLGDSELSTVASGRLAAVAGPLPPGGLQRSTESVLRHGAIVEALQQCGPTLPVRFGTVVPDAEAVVCALEERHPELYSALTWLGDKVEIGLTVLWDHLPDDDDPRSKGSPDDDGTEHGPGARYLRRRLVVARREEARRQIARTIVRELDAALGTLVLDRRCSLAPTERLAIRAAFLIEPIRFDACRHAIAEVRERHPDLRVLVSGPWSPYSFVSREPGGDRDPLATSLNIIGRCFMPLVDAGERTEYSPVSTRGN
ncbi:MAG: GvpL/GvpF family gas vesicle protein [Chloroflexota bacterium]